MSWLRRQFQMFRARRKPRVPVLELERAPVARERQNRQLTTWMDTDDCKHGDKDMLVQMETLGTGTTSNPITTAMSPDATIQNSSAPMCSSTIYGGPASSSGPLIVTLVRWRNLHVDEMLSKSYAALKCCVWPPPMSQSCERRVPPGQNA